MVHCTICSVYSSIKSYSEQNTLIPCSFTFVLFKVLSLSLPNLRFYFLYNKFAITYLLLLLFLKRNDGLYKRVAY
jgi:hypothetical protein